MLNDGGGREYIVGKALSVLIFARDSSGVLWGSCCSCTGDG